MRRNFFIIFSVLIMSVAASAYAQDDFFPVTSATASMADVVGQARPAIPTSRCSNKHLFTISNEGVIAEYAYDGSLLNDNFRTLTDSEGNRPDNITAVAVGKGVLSFDKTTYVYFGDINRFHVVGGDGKIAANGRPVYDANAHIPGWTDIATNSFSLYFYNRTTGEVVQTKWSGSVLRTLPVTLPNYDGFATDGAYLYFYEADNGRVRQTDLQGNTIEAVYATLPTGLDNIAIDANFSCQPGPDLATGRTAIQSSDWEDTSTATRAVDSNINGHYGNGSVSHTGYDPAPWWQVDLNHQYTLELLRLWNRTDCCEDRLKNFHIFVSDTDMSQRPLSELIADPAVWHHHETGVASVEYNLPVNGVNGRYVRIQKADAGHLQLAEVQVFGKNLALGKPVTQSTTRDGGDYDASNLVDGDLTTHHGTNTSSASWVQVDLGNQMQVGQLSIHRSEFFHRYSARDYYIFVSDSDMLGRTTYDLLNDPSVWKYEGTLRGSSKLRINATGRYIRYQLPDIGALGLGELMIYGAERRTTLGDVLGDALNDAYDNTEMPPHIYGQWSDLITWPNHGVHAAVLADGTVLTLDDSLPYYQGDSHRRDKAASNAKLWDYRTGQFTEIYPYTDAKFVRSGHGLLPDGTFFSTGGNKTGKDGIPVNHLFNHETQEWIRKANTSHVRSYPSVTPLDTGEMLLTSGRGLRTEVYDYRSDTTRILSDDIARGVYPMLQQASDGFVFVGGPSVYMQRFDPAGEGPAIPMGRRDNTHRDYAGYGVYDTDRMVVSGGGRLPIDTTLEMNMLTGEVSESGRMQYGRRNHNTTILPDGTLLATGGFTGLGTYCGMHAGTTAAEMWSPETGKWQIMSSMRQTRSYLSTAVLLPDARVMAIAGQNWCYHHHTAEIFSPPYLFNEDGSLADRPVIASAPDQIGYNAPFEATIGGANEIVSASLIRPSSVTHSNNMGQRRISLNVTQAGDVVTVSGVTGPTIVQPGVYMLFVSNSDGVPSVAKMIQVGTAEPSTEQTEYNFDFGTDTSPVQSGWTRVTTDTNDVRVSWSDAPRGQTDRGAISGINNINRDLVYGSEPSTLSLNIGSGTWKITINMGDASHAHDQMRVLAEGQTIGQNVNSAIGQFPYVTGDVIVSDGVLDLQFSDDGGNDPNWVLTRLSLSKVSNETKPPLKDKYDFDFGTSASPLRDGWTRITPVTHDSLVQWVGYPVTAQNRDVNGSINAINRDFVTSHNAGKINFNVGNGLWRVTMNMGDSRNAYDGMVVKAEGRTIVRNISTEAGEFKYISRRGGSLTPASFDVGVMDGVLTVEIGDNGGELPHWALTRLSLRKVIQTESD